MAAEADPFPAHGEVSALIRAKDWSTTPLGAPATWSPSLLTVLRLMLTSRYAMWMGWGPELSFFYNDAYAEQTLGAKHPWALGRPAREVWAEIWPTLDPRIQHVLKTGEATWDEGLRLFLARNGYPEETYHTFSYSPAPGDEPGKIAGLFCVVIEETQRVIGDRQLGLLRNLAASLAETKTRDEVFTAVERCLVVDAHDVPFSLTYLFDEDGKTAHRVSQTSFSGPHAATKERIAIDDGSPWPFREVLASGTARTVELPRNGDWPCGAWDIPPSRALVIPLARQGQAGAAGVFIAGINPYRPFDDTIRRFVDLFVGQLAAGLANATAYEETRKRAEALAELDRAKTAFFSNVSHEFRTPLTLMLGPTEDALGSPDRALRGTDLETVHRNELRLLRLVNGLLDFARIEAGRIHASYAPTDLRALTLDLASTFRSAVERAGLDFEVDCEILPEPIFIDHEMWEKIVLNLLSNALKFTFDGRISIALRWSGEGAVLTVTDTGGGIAEAELPRVFERFHRIEGARARTHEGSGIGLALVHELVRLHGGSIEVESKLDHGTRFTITIPRGSAHLNRDNIGSQTSKAGSNASAAYVEEALRWTPSSDAPGPRDEVELPDESRARILVVDDNADMRDYIARLLRQHWNVEAVADGIEALEAVRRRKPDLVLSDVMMPRLDGFGLIRELKGDPKTATTPIILLSARAGDEATAEGLRGGADDYMFKPFSASALLVRVEAQLSAARLRETLRRTTESERSRLESMFRQSPAAICMFRGPELVIELANPLILEVWGKTSDVIGKPFLEAVPEIRGQGFYELLQDVLATGNIHEGKERLVRLDRDRNGVLADLYFDFVYAPAPSHEGEAAGVFVHAYDVTDKVIARRASEQHREAEKQARQDAEAANRLKDEFLATMSHELRTPLNAILGWASLLRRGMEDKKSTERALATIERNARTQQRLIEDVLDVSRIISGKLRLELRRVDMASISTAAVDVVRPAADAKRVRIIIESPDEGVDLVGDPDRLQQIIWNLLSNAVKFTPSDGSVSLRVERVGSSVEIVVRDTGAGIAPEHLPFIFERFRQADSSTTRKYGGLGLGLAIVRHLVELHGGSVQAESEGPDKGASFSVLLPIRAVHVATPEGEDTGERLVSSAWQRPITRLTGIKVLVVDDDEDSRSLLMSALERAGASVDMADSAAAAFAFMAESSVDVLVSDISMPDEDGLSLIRRVRANSSRLRASPPAIALTAHAGTADIARALGAGYQRHLAKPADVDELAEMVATLVKQKSA